MRRVTEDMDVVLACIVKKCKCEVRSMPIYKEETASASGFVFGLFIELLDPGSADLAIGVPFLRVA